MCLFICAIQNKFKISKTSVVNSFTTINLLFYIEYIITFATSNFFLFKKKILDENQFTSEENFFFNSNSDVVSPSWKNIIQNSV